MPTLSRHLKADLLLAFCTLIWGTTFVIVKNALVDASDLVFLTLRFLVAAAVLALIYRREIPPLLVPRLRTRTLAGGILMGSLLFGGFALQTAGLRFTSPSKAAFITGFSVILVPVLLGLAGGARLNIWVWAGAFAALAGLYCLTVPSAGELARLNRGDLLVLCAAVLFALHIISVGVFTPHHSPGALSLIQVLTMSFLTLIAAPAFALTGWQPARLNPTPELVGAVLTTGVLATALAFSAQIWAQQHASSSHTAILFSLEPVFAAITSFVFLHERLGARALAGAALIFVGILLVELREPTKPAAPESPGSGSVVEPAE